MAPKPQKKTRQAYAIILAAIERGEYADEKYPPSVASLAARIGVSVATIWRAIDLLKKEGRLEGGPGCRTVLAGNRTASTRIVDKEPSPPPRQTKSDALQVRI